MHTPDLSANWPGRDAESLLWLASYPRSGNTFARILLANYFSAQNEAFDINRLGEFITSDTNIPSWEGIFPSSPDKDYWETVWKARPAVIARYRVLQGARAVPGLKTHTANIKTFDTEGFEFRPNDRALYMVRHPLDVLISLADFNAKDIDKSIDAMLSSGFAVCEPEYAKRMEVRGSWAEHVSSWTITPPCPVLLVRYEDLCSTPMPTLRSILTFLGAPIDEARLRWAVSVSRFDELREQETRRNFIERPDYTHSGRFFREGTTLQWLRQLTPRQASRLADGCGKLMESLGYVHPRNVLFDGRNALGPLRVPDQNLKPDSMRSL